MTPEGTRVSMTCRTCTEAPSFSSAIRPGTRGPCYDEGEPFAIRRRDGKFSSGLRFEQRALQPVLSEHVGAFVASGGVHHVCSPGVSGGFPVAVTITTN
jgi:hypothetical protein